MATNMCSVRLTDNSELIEQATEANIRRALERVGFFVEDEAKLELAKDPIRTKTGALRNSITHTTLPRRVIIGTNLKYAV